MVTQYGMSDKFGLMGLAETQDQYLGGKAYLNCGDETATEIDHEVMAMLKKAYEEAKKLLSENRDALDKIADYLITKETITGAEFMDIYHKVLEEREAEKQKQLTQAPPVIELPDTQAQAPGAPETETPEGNDQ
jgi:cell division protease FtsH